MVLELKYSEPTGATFDRGLFNSGPSGTLKTGPIKYAFWATDKSDDMYTSPATDNILPRVVVSFTDKVDLNITMLFTDNLPTIVVLP